MALGVAMLASGCDPQHPFDDVRVKARLRADGSAAVAVDAYQQAMTPGVEEWDDGALSDEVARRTGLGTPVGAPQLYSDQFGFDTVGVEIAPATAGALTLRLDDLASVLDDLGIAGDATVFVSICNAAGTGGASATGMETEMKDSCAVWEGRVADLPANGAVTVVTPVRAGGSDIGYIVALAIIAVIGATALWGLSPAFRRRRALARIGVAGAAVAAFVQPLVHIRTGNDGGFLTTGQDIGEDRASWLGLASLALVVLLGIGAAVQATRTHRHRRTRSNWPPPTAAPA